PLISDLALILIVAAAVTILFKQLKQPLVLGYIIAGLLVGPYLSLTPTVVDLENVKTLADIGVIFLLFSLGLEFSFKKLARVGGSASITAIVEIAFITVAGYALGKAFGWSTMDCLFLGGMLASSSTTIILKAFDDLGVKSKNYARIVFGVLVVEDIVVILLMVLLSTVAVTQHFEGSEMLFTIGKLLFFLILWFLMGIFIIPTLLKRIKKLLDEETYLVLSTGFCLVMVVVATQAGFSAELGAFIMGSILAETTSAEKIEHTFKPVKDLFGAVFFVSVGMMINPSVIVQYGWIVLAVTLLTIFGKLFSSTLGAIFSGQPLKQSVQVGMSMAQIGEFAFIVATLGMSLGVISDFLFPVAVGASAITTFTTPYMIKYSDGFYNFLERILPKKLLITIEAYSASARTIQAESEWKQFVKKIISTIVTNGIIILTIMFVGIRVLLPLLSGIIPNEPTARIAAFSLTFLITLPFLWGFMFKRPNDMEYRELWEDKKYKNGPLFIMEAARITIGIVLLGYLVNRIFSTFISIAIIVPLLIVALFLLSKNIRKFYSYIESRFMSNLNSREIAAEQKTSPLKHIQKKMDSKENLSTWDAHLVDLIVPQDAAYVGRTLKELPWREKYGISVVYIRRGDNLIYAPGANAKILPFDHIGVIASDEQAQVFKPVFEMKEPLQSANYNVDDIVIEKFVVDEHNRLNGVLIKNSGIREKTNGMIIGLERNDERIPNPAADTVLQEHDIVWIVGEKKQLKKLRNPLN
ncbi:MAG: cation:proton antiporter, partial [Prevotellaceae bacterium]|nr:cation:proton antiporter [Prevotellaceae bacterium]